MVRIHSCPPFLSSHGKVSLRSFNTVLLVCSGSPIFARIGKPTENSLRFQGSKEKGRLAEAKAVAHLIENGYEVYLPFSGNSKYDLLAVKDTEVVRVSVKYTSQQLPSGSWEVTMKNVSRRNHGVIKVDLFDKRQYDMIVVYIGPLDKIVLVDAQRATPNLLTIEQEDLDNGVLGVDQSGRSATLDSC